MENEKIDTQLPVSVVSTYQFPSLDLLQNQVDNNDLITQDINENKERIMDALKMLRIRVSNIEVTVGPTVSLYEIIPGEGVRLSTLIHWEREIIMCLATHGVRMIAPHSGRATVGFEIPNRHPQVVPVKTVISSGDFRECRFQLPIALGISMNNNVCIADLTKMPHLLIAGSSGQGKTVALNSIITSLLYRKRPDELKFVLIDPKLTEFTQYERLKDYYIARLEREDSAVVTDPDNIQLTLNALCCEMDNRFRLLKDADARSINEYNRKFEDNLLDKEKGHRYLPYIVVIIDEYSDPLVYLGSAFEKAIVRIAQKSRAVGIHMIITTQRPSPDVITGSIKANFPAHMAFRVARSLDSKTILDQAGAEQLIGRGDSLVFSDCSLDRVQCAFVNIREIDSIVESICSQSEFKNPYFLPTPTVTE